MKGIFPCFIILFLYSEHAFGQCNNISIVVNSVLPAKCAGTATGSAFVSTTGATSPLQYFADGTGTPFTNGGITNHFTAGNHSVVVIDALGCRDTVFFNITEPPAIAIQTSTIDASCNGDNDGSATATASAGNGSPYIFQWQGCTGGSVVTGATASNLFAGCYNVTVSDSKDCETTAQVTVSEPPGFIFQTQQDSVDCFGGSNGSATIIVSGAQPPYTYSWANGGTNSSTSGLNANFHSVTVTDATGCQRTTFVQVLQPTRVDIDSVPAIGVPCFNQSTGSATVFVKGGTKPYTFLWEGGQTTKTAVNLDGGEIYSVTVTDSKGCTDVSTTAIPEPPAIQLVTNNIAPETCAGKCDGTAKLNISGGFTPYNINWGTPNVPNGTTQPTNLCAGTYTITVTDSKNCSNTTSVTITAATAMVLQSIDTDPKCTTSTDGNINLTVSGGGSPYIYKWSNNATTQDLTNIGCGNFTVTVTDQKGCVSTKSVVLDCPPILTVNNLTVVDVKCFGGNTGSISAAATGGTGTITYIWNDPNQQTSATAINLPANTYTVVVRDANGCTAVGTKTVNQPTALFATITPTDVKCFGESSGSATANPSGGVSPYQFNWTGGKTGQTLQNVPAGNYNLTLTDANGCTFNQAATTISQPATAVQVVAIQTDTACFGVNAGAASASATGGNGSPYNFLWSGNQNSPVINLLAPGSYSVTATDPKGCTSTSAVTIGQYLEIKANVATSSPTCYGLNNGTATVNMVSGGAGNSIPTAYQYNWSVANPPTATSITNLSGGQNYQLTISDARGCLENFEFFLDQPEPVSVEAMTKSVSCFGLSDGEATISQVLGGFPATNFSWSNGSNLNKISGVAAGTYFVTVTNSKGCTGETPIEVLQPDEFRISKFEIKPLECTGDSVGGAKPILTGGTPNYTFLWGNGATTPEISKLGAGEFFVTVTDANGCKAVDSVEIFQPAIFDLTAQVSDVECFGQKNGRVQLKLSGGNPPFKFNRDGVVFQNSATFFGLSAGEFWFYAKDSKGCERGIAVKVNEPAQLNLTLPPDTSIILGDSLLIFPTVENAVGIVNYEWKSGYVETLKCIDTLDCSSIEVKPIISNQYTLQITDENGCADKAQIEVKVDRFRGLYVPTAFTPNEDATNDLLTVFGKGRVIREVLVFRVFDRWGELVFEDKNFKINDLTRGWDGKFRDRYCPTGQYSWFAEVEYLDGYREVARGGTMLMR